MIDDDNINDIDLPDFNENELESLMKQIMDIQSDDDDLELDEDGNLVAHVVFRNPYVRVSDNGMEAYIYVPNANGRPSREWLLGFLRENGVTRGIDSNNFNMMVQDPEYDKEVLIAEGREPEEGKDGYYSYTFDPLRYKAPHIREDGSVDYSAMNSLVNVRAGQVVAYYHPAVPGVDGFKVTGESIKSGRVKDLPPIRGKQIEQDGDRYLAKVDGKVEEVDGRIDIKQVHEINGNVDSILGKVEFFGDIIVKGDVDTGVTIRAGRNIEIRGSVSDAVLFAGGDIIITQGVSGSDKSRISARGSVFSDFLENAQVKAGYDVNANSILNCNVEAGRNVTVTGEKGLILGGVVHGFSGVSCTEAGNDKEIRTLIHVGYLKEMYDRYLDYRKQEADIKRRLQEIVAQITSSLQTQRIQALRRETVDDTGPADKGEEMTAAAKLQVWTRKKNDLFYRLEELKPQMEAVEQQIAMAERSEIKIAGNVYKGVTIGINDKRLQIQENNMFMRYRLQYGVIESSVIII